MKSIDQENKLVVKWVAGIIILAICIFISNKEEIKENMYTKITIDHEVIDDLSVLDKEIEDKEIIFTAEFHGVKTNMELELKFLKYIKERTNFNYYLCELPYAQGLMLNKFLETGDTDILNELYSHYKGTYAYTKDSYNRWLELYEYNKQFELKDQIKVIGVDVEHQVDYALKVINELLPKNIPPAEIKENINLLKIGDSDRDMLAAVHKDLLERQTLYEAYLGKYYFDIELIVRNINNLYYVKEDNQVFNARRDAVIYENFMDIYETLDEGIFYGQWGHNHTYQAEEGGVKWFAAALEEGTFKDKILTIAYTYNNCEAMSKKADGSYGIESLDTFSGYDLKEGDSQTALLFDIQDTQSPLYSPENKKYYQYLLVISNSEATEPLF